MSAFCCSCHEEFPVSAHGLLVRMGYLFPLADMPKRLRDRFASWRDDEDGAYLCGNCYCDLTDEW